MKDDICIVLATPKSGGASEYRVAAVDWEYFTILEAMQNVTGFLPTTEALQLKQCFLESKVYDREDDAWRKALALADKQKISCGVRSIRLHGAFPSGAA